MKNSKIEWCHHTFNPWRGCEHAALPDGSKHPACNHCYAEALSKRNPAALGQWGADGTRIKAADKAWREVATWNMEAACLRTFDCNAGAHSDACPQSSRPRVFCASLADVFEDRKGLVHNHKGQVVIACDCCGKLYDEAKLDADPLFCCPCGRMGQRMEEATLDDLRRQLFALIDATPNLDWLLLTKRPENIQRMWLNRAGESAAATSIWSQRFNVWLGTSISDQATANALVPELLKCHELAPVLFLSAEPLLGATDISDWLGPQCPFGCGKMSGFGGTVCTQCEWCCDDEPPSGVNWVIVGGESGPHARPLHPAWASSLRNQCQAAGVPFFFKQWGEWEPSFNFAEQFTGVPDSTPVKHSPDGKGMWVRTGKKAAGRMLFGRTWDQIPEPTR